MENFCQFGAQCAYKHQINDSTHVQKQLGTSDIEESQNDLKIQLLEAELKVLKSQILQLGCLTRELIDKVDLVTTSQVSKNPVEVTKKKVTKQLKFKCDQCNCSFKREITLKKHKNTNHGQIQEKLGEGHFGYIFDVIPGKEDEAKSLREEWRNEQAGEQILSRDKSSSLSDIEEDDKYDDSEDDDAFLAKYDSDGNFIG